MVTQPVPQPKIHSPEEYLAIEREAEFKSEYLNGEIYALAGGSPKHSIITVNVTAIVALQLRGKPCMAFSNDMKVRTRGDALYAYPDLTVVYEEPVFHDRHQDVLLNPAVIIEVLSPPTEADDRGKKFAQYQRIESLTDYLLVAQEEPRIDHFVRQPGNRWLLTAVSGMEARLAIASIGCTLLLAEVYDKAFPTA